VRIIARLAIPLLAFPAVLGCTPAGTASTGGTVLKGANAAIGGVNLQNDQKSSSNTWDKHITSCHYSGAGKELVFGGDGSDYLRVSVDTGMHRATLYGPSGTLVYEGDACSVYKLKGLQQAPPFDGHISLVCSKDHQDLTASVRFERCGL